MVVSSPVGYGFFSLPAVAALCAVHAKMDEGQNRARAQQRKREDCSSDFLNSVLKNYNNGSNMSLCAIWAYLLFTFVASVER